MSKDYEQWLARHWVEPIGGIAKKACLRRACHIASDAGFAWQRKRRSRSGRKHQNLANLHTQESVTTTSVIDDEWLAAWKPICQFPELPLDNSLTVLAQHPTANLPWCVITHPLKGGFICTFQCNLDGSSDLWRIEGPVDQRLRFFHFHRSDPLNNLTSAQHRAECHFGDHLSSC
jgi:hypothetical protein